MPGIPLHDGFYPWLLHNRGFPCGSVVKNPSASPGDMGSIPGLRRSPGGGSGNPLLYSWLESPMNRGAWWAAVHRVTNSRAHLSDWECTRCGRRARAMLIPPQQARHSVKCSRHHVLFHITSWLAGARPSILQPYRVTLPHSTTCLVTY